MPGIKKKISENIAKLPSSEAIKENFQIIKEHKEKINCIFKGLIVRILPLAYFVNTGLVWKGISYHVVIQRIIKFAKLETEVVLISLCQTRPLWLMVEISHQI